jgi:23S rRNA (uracil1939-C5)-methyltransferase
LEPCVHSKECGGCIYQSIAYEDQLVLKAKEVRRHFDENSIEVDNFLGIEGSPDRYRYRNKMEYTFGDEVKDGELTLGLHKHGHFYSITTTDKCQLVDDDFNTILSASLEFCRKEGYSFYHKKRHEGLLRHLIIRKGRSTGEILVNLVTSTEPGLDTKKFVDQMCGLKLSGHVVGVLHTENNKVSDAVIPERVSILWGRDHYNEELLGLKFKVSAFSFFQTNVRAAERLYAESLTMLSDIGGKTVLDLYSGTGTIAQAAALSAKKVIGIELVEEAVEAARVSAEENKLNNCVFYSGDVLNVLDEIEEAPDIIFIDPPRAGVHPKAMTKILNYGVKEIIYISCNPKTQAKNLVIAKDLGYRIKTLKAYDNFPFTRHTETICLLEKM